MFLHLYTLHLCILHLHIFASSYLHIFTLCFNALSCSWHCFVVFVESRAQGAPFRVLMRDHVIDWHDFAKPPSAQINPNVKNRFGNHLGVWIFHATSGMFCCHHVVLGRMDQFGSWKMDPHFEAKLSIFGSILGPDGSAASAKNTPAEVLQQDPDSGWSSFRLLQH